MESAFVAIVPTRPCPLFGRPVHRRDGSRRLRPGASPHALRIPPHGGHPALLDSHRGQRGVTPAFGYGALHPSTSGTSTHLSTSLPSAHYVPLRLLTRHRPGFRNDVLMPRLPRGVDPRPREISLVALMALPAFRSPYAGGFFEAARPVSSPLPWPSRQMKRWAPS